MHKFCVLRIGVVVLNPFERLIEFLFMSVNIEVLVLETLEESLLCRDVKKPAHFICCVNNQVTFLSALQQDRFDAGVFNRSVLCQADPCMKLATLFVFFLLGDAHEFFDVIISYLRFCVIKGGPQVLLLSDLIIQFLAERENVVEL